MGRTLEISEKEETTLVGAYPDDNIFSDSSVVVGNNVWIGGYLTKADGKTGIEGKEIYLRVVGKSGFEDMLIGTTDKNGYVVKGWEPDDTYEGVKTYDLIFKGDIKYKEGLSSQFELFVGTDIEVTCREKGDEFGQCISTFQECNKFCFDEGYPISSVLPLAEDPCQDISTEIQGCCCSSK